MDTTITTWTAEAAADIVTETLRRRFRGAVQVQSINGYLAWHVYHAVSGEAFALRIARDVLEAGEMELLRWLDTVTDHALRVPKEPRTYLIFAGGVRITGQAAAA